MHSANNHLAEGKDAFGLLSQKLWEHVALIRVPYYPVEHRIAFVNIFVILDKDPILIDMGPWQPNLFRDLSSCFHQLGLSLSDVKRVVFTHAHPDHMGGALAFKDGSRFSYMAHAEAKQFVENYGAYVDTMKRHFKNSVISHQLKDESKKNIYLSVAEAFWCPSSGSIQIHKQLFEGDIIETGKLRFEVIFTPGHSPWDISLWEKDKNLIFTGDFLMERMTTMVGPLMGFGSDLKLYIESLSKIKKILTGNERIIPSHGNIIKDAFGAVEKISKSIVEREQRIIDRIRQHPATLLELESIFLPTHDPLIFVRRMGLLLCHLEKLKQEGIIAERKTENGIFYHLA